MAKFRDSLCHSHKRTFVFAEINDYTQASLSDCMWRERDQRHHVWSLGNWRSWLHVRYSTLTIAVTTAEANQKMNTIVT